MLHFPEQGDPKFRDNLMKLEEYQMFQIPPLEPLETVQAYEEKVAQYCSGFEKTLYQHLMQHYLSYRSPYRSLLLYHGLGVGKTCSSITIAESLLVDHSTRDPPKIWVILPTTLQDSYMDQLYSFGKMHPDSIMEQCTGITYDLLAASSKDVDSKKKRIEQLIKGRYKMMTYEGFASEVDKLKEKGALHKLTNKVFIVDEAHNLRIEETDKRVASALMEVATNCENNRLVLLSATPMYNEPDEIFWLLSLLLANDKRTVPSFKPLFNQRGEIAPKSFAHLKQLASEYISYIRGVNPFTFATRLSPSVSGIPLLGDEWTVAIPDGLVPTEIGQDQRVALKTLKKSDAVLHQAGNVCFPVGSTYKVGKKGFDAVLGRDDAEGPFKYKNKETENVLMPTADKLGRYGTKLQRLCDLIRNSRGIVVVYSQFVWGGIVPLAAALEHMGFQRHAASNILHKPDVIKPRVSYPGIPFPTYCIISGDAQIMGGTRIDELVRDINRADNAHGENVKVVLMSPIAGEGLSLKNVREVHVMDPWYHLNRLHQVIGRAIRTCSHTSLPLKERNVTVFLHVATNGEEDTMDIHTYKIAARKSLQTRIAEVVIRDHAVDCALVKNVHYFPKELFRFKITYETSRGNEFTFQFGDDASNSPVCDLPAVTDSTTMRSEVVQELIPTGLQRLRKHLHALKDAETTPRLSRDDLLKAIRFPKNIASIILEHACKPNALFSGYTLQAHRGSFVIQRPSKERKSLKLSVSSNAQTVPPSAVNDDSSYEKLLASISTENKAAALIQIYQSLDSEQWPHIATTIINYGGNIPLRIQKQVELLVKEGAFVSASELPSHQLSTGAQLIGYIDIFDTANMHIILRDVQRKVYRDATQSEVASILSKRQLVEKPNLAQTTFLYGALEPHAFKNQNMKRFEFKLYVPGPSVGKRTGIVCINTKKPFIVDELSSLGVKYTDTQLKSETKDTLCMTLAIQLHNNKRLFVAPAYKPK